MTKSTSKLLFIIPLVTVGSLVIVAFLYHVADTPPSMKGMKDQLALAERNALRPPGTQTSRA